jgi:hypothetical protein
MVSSFTMGLSILPGDSGQNSESLERPMHNKAGFIGQLFSIVEEFRVFSI